jgi:hypothetical protein
VCVHFLSRPQRRSQRQQGLSSARLTLNEYQTYKQVRESTFSLAEPSDHLFSSMAGVLTGGGSLRGLQENNRHYDPVDEVDTYTKSGCTNILLSNDPPASNALANIAICDVTEYMCSASTTMLQVRFKYEVQYNPVSKIQQHVLPYLEEALLEHISTHMGVHDCSASYGGGHRRLSFTEEQKAHIAGLSLLPRDVAVNNKDCTVTVDTVTDDTLCSPVDGSLTVYTNEKLSEVDNGVLGQALLNEIQYAMDEDFFVVPGIIDKIVFVENKTYPGVSDRDQSSGGMSTLAVGLVSGLGVLGLLILGILLFFVCRRRRKRAKIDDKQQQSNSAKAVVWEGPGDSLAVRDSLALQAYPSDDTSIDTVISLSPDRPKEGSPSIMPRPPSSISLNRTLNSFDAAMYELDVIAELTMQQGYVNSVMSGDSADTGSAVTPGRAL